jgi:hypothetical protein
MGERKWAKDLPGAGGYDGPAMAAAAADAALVSDEYVQIIMTFSFLQKPMSLSHCLPHSQQLQDPSKNLLRPRIEESSHTDQSPVQLGTWGDRAPAIHWT